MTTKDELIEVCKKFAESEGESVAELFEAIMDYPLEDIPDRPSTGHVLWLKRANGLPGAVPLFGVPSLQ